jgi:hypothetical protein
MVLKTNYTYFSLNGMSIINGDPGFSGWSRILVSLGEESVSLSMDQRS